MNNARLSPDPGVLSGLLVLDFGQAAVGPVAAEYLGMMGATVVKVEQPSGDMVRFGNPTMKGTSTTFIGNNLTKRGVVLDLKKPEGLAAAKKLIAKADLLIENFRSPEIMIRLGLDYETELSKLNPNLIYVQSSAFGSKGPWTGMFSDEWMSECVSGFVSMTGSAKFGGEFTRGSALLDWNGAMVNTVVCLASIFERARTGKGMMVRTSQLGSSIFSGLTRISEFVASGKVQTPNGSASAYLVPDQAFLASDGFVNVTVNSDACWERFCDAICRPDLSTDSLFATIVGRFEHRNELIPILEKVFTASSVVEWCNRLRVADVPCGPNPNRESLTKPQLAHPQVIANTMLSRVDSAYGSILSHAPHWRFEKTPARISRPSPLLGEHTKAVLESIDDWKPRSLSQAQSNDTQVSGCLAGIRVVECASGVSGPLCGMVLAQLGAKVIRIEAPDGDWMRGVPPLQDGEGSIYRVLNSEKQTLKIDLRTEVGQKLARESISSADVVLVGYREQKLERLGLSYQQVCAIAPRTLYCHISGWGPSGPDSQVAATELQVQAVAGMHRYLGRDGEAPVRIGFDLASTATALAAAQGILAGLLWRLDSGVGQRIDVSMLASAIAINQWSTVAESAPDSIVGRQLKGQDWPRDHGFASREGPCLIGFRQPGVWQRFVVAIGRVDLLVDPVFLNAINTHPPLFAHKVESTLCTWSMESLDKLVRGELGGTLVPVLNLKSLLDHEQVRNLSIVNHSTVLKVSLPLDTTANLLVKAQHE